MMHTYQTNLEMKVSKITDVKDYFSENIFNMHIMTVLMHFHTINKVFKYEARASSLHRKTVIKALKTCAHSHSICHKLTSSYNNHCVSVICLLNSRESSLVKTQFIFHGNFQQGTASHRQVWKRVSVC